MLDFLTHKKIDALTEKYLSVFQHIKSVAKKFSDEGGVLMTVQDSGGVFGCQSKLTENQAYFAGLTGIVKTAALEWPKAHCKAIDINCAHHSQDVLAKKILQEFLYYSHDLEREIGLPTEEIRIKLETVREDLPPLPLQNLEKNTVFLVTGGAKGITAACIIALAEHQACRFALLGRTVLTEEPEFCRKISDPKQLKLALISHLSKEPGMQPKKMEQVYQSILANRDIERTLERLKQLGSEAFYLSVDIQQKEKLSLALETVRKKWGNIDGIIHGAGVLADKLIVDKTKEQFQKVFETKVVGLQHLLSLTQKDELSHLYLFSSVAGRYGNIGQSDYAAANEVLNKIAQTISWQRKECRVKSFNWAPWETGMVDEKLMKMFQEKNIPILSQKEGSAYFVSEILQPKKKLSEIEIIYGDLKQSRDVSVEMTFDLDPAHHLYLNSHMIKNNIVVPACLVLDWFMRSAGETKKMCRNFKILQGIQLSKHDKSDIFSIQIEKKAEHQKLTLLDGQGKKRYTGEFVKQPLLGEDNIPRLQGVEQPWPWKEEELYQTVHRRGPLFHGEYFHAIKKLCFFSDTGASAIVHSYQSMAKQYARSWPKENWKCDILALDGALQLLLLWTKTAIGKTSLPVSFEEVSLYQSDLPTHELYCEFYSKTLDNYRTKSDIYLFDHQNSLYAKLLGVEMCSMD